MPAPYRPPIAPRSRATLNKVNTRGIHYDFFNYLTTDIIKYENDFLGYTTGLFGNTSTTPFQGTEFFTGGAGTAAAIVANGANGLLNLVCSSNGSSLYLGQRNLQPDQNPTIMCQLALSSAAAVKVEIGFASTNATATLGATAQGLITAAFGATPAVNTASADGCCLIYDSTATGGTNPTDYKIIGSVAGTTKRFDATGGQVTGIRKPVASTMQSLVLQLRRVAVASEDIDAEAWVNNVSLGVSRGANCTFNTAMFPYVVVYSASAGKTLQLDYFNVYAQRDTTN